jgi:hypothetical protein
MSNTHLVAHKPQEIGQEFRRIDVIFNNQDSPARNWRNPIAAVLVVASGYPCILMVQVSIRVHVFAPGFQLACLFVKCGKMTPAGLSFQDVINSIRQRVNRQQHGERNSHGRSGQVSLSPTVNQIPSSAQEDCSNWEQAPV